MKVLYNDRELDFEPGPGNFSVFIHDGSDEPVVPGTVEMSAQETVEHAELFPDEAQWHPKTRFVVEQVLAETKGFDPATLSDPTARRSVQTKHLIGLVDGTLKLIELGMSPHWKYPETYCHPNVQRHLMEAAKYVKAYAEWHREWKAGVRKPHGEPDPKHFFYHLRRPADDGPTEPIP
jgi:hypothetical protein